jgi:transcriptional regulator with XRE-family HTH domain
LRTWREAQGLSQRELSRRSGIDRGLISRIEADKQLPSLEVLEQLAAVLGIDPLSRAVAEIRRYRP